MNKLVRVHRLSDVRASARGQGLIFRSWSEGPKSRSHYTKTYQAQAVSRYSRSSIDTACIYRENPNQECFLCTLGAAISFGDIK